MSDINLDLAPAWRPEVGEVLVGKVTDVSRSWSEQGEKYYPIITIRPEKPVTIHTDDGPAQTSEPVAVHCFHTALYNRVVELRPELNERIGIKYVKATAPAPKGSGRKGNLPAIYNVKVDGRTSDVWDVMDVDPREAQARAARAKSAQLPIDAEDFTAQTTPTATADDDDIPF